MVVWGGGVVGTSDNVLRPLLAGRGVKLDGITLFFGLLGGMAAFGLIGLFLGPIVLYTLRGSWRSCGATCTRPPKPSNPPFARRSEEQGDAEDQTKVCRRQVENAHVFTTVEDLTDLQEHIHIDIGGKSSLQSVQKTTILEEDMARAQGKMLVRRRCLLIVVCTALMVPATAFQQDAVTVLGSARSGMASARSRTRRC